MFIIVPGVFNYRSIVLKLIIPAGIALSLIVIVGLPLLIITSRNVSIINSLRRQEGNRHIALIHTHIYIFSRH
jgi:hypothetical protein